MIRTSHPAPLFSPGDLVQHRRYGYRGVVVEADSLCQADEAWYQKNQTQPDRNQPWYHVLVDGGMSVTYAAQESLQADEMLERIEHPLVGQFFDSFEAGKYVRNDTPWPL